MNDGPRAVGADDADETMALINRVFREGSDQDAVTDYPLVYDPAMRKYRRIVKVDGKVVAHVPVAPREVVHGTDRYGVGLISATVTHADYRGRGLGTQCLRDCVRIMEDEGMPLSVLWTMESTFPFYQNSGWEAVASQGWVFSVQPSDAGLFERHPFDLVQYEPGDSAQLDDIIRIHEREPQRISRSRSEFEALLSLPKTATLLATRGSETAGYLTYGWASNKTGLFEAGGDPAAVETMVRRALDTVFWGFETQVVVPLASCVLGSLLNARLPSAKRPVEDAAGIGQQMHRVNDLYGLLHGLRDHLRTKSKGLTASVTLWCDEVEQAVTLKLDDGSVEVSKADQAEGVALTRRQLSQLIFGAHPSASPVEVGGEAGRVLDRLFPYSFALWELDHC